MTEANFEAVLIGELGELRGQQTQLLAGLGEVNFVKAPALRGVCLRERRGDDSATYIMPLGALVYKERIHRRFAMRERMIQRADV